MPDPSKSVPIELSGKTYTLYYGNKALRLAERESGLSMDDPAWREENMNLHLATIMVWAGLQTFHPGISMDDVDDFIDENGMQYVVSQLEKASAAAQAKRNGETSDPEAVGAAGAGTSTNGRPSKRASRSKSSGS